MKNRVLAVLSITALAVSVLFAAPATAEAPELPAAPNIVDDQGDAETDSTQGDLWHAWFSEDGPSITFHFNNAAPPPPSAYGTEWRIYASPNADGTECFQLRAQVPAGVYVGDAIARIFDVCEVGDNWFNHPVAEAPVEFGEMADGSGYIQTTFEKAALSYISDGETIAAPRAQAHFLMGAQAGGFNAPMVDDTEVGNDYTVGGGEQKIAPPESEDPGKKDKAPAKKGCKKKKGKGKKKGCAKGKGPKEEPKTCAPYVPGEQGAEAETLTITDSATEEAPLSVEFDAGVGMGGPVTGIAPVPPDQTTRTYHNIQIDTDNEEVGLYARLDFQDRRDYDLYLRYPDGTEATHSGDFNSGYGTPIFICGEESTGCSSGSSFEQVNGIRMSDCAGWTVETVAFLTEGGDVTLSFWLGEATTDPAPLEPPG